MIIENSLRVDTRDAIMSLKALDTQADLTDAKLARVGAKLDSAFGGGMGRQLDTMGSNFKRLDSGVLVTSRNFDTLGGHVKTAGGEMDNLSTKTEQAATNTKTHTENMAAHWERATTQMRGDLQDLYNDIKRVADAAAAIAPGGGGGGGGDGGGDGGGGGLFGRMGGGAGDSWRRNRSLLWRKGGIGPLQLGGLSLSTMLGLGPEHVIGSAAAIGGSAIGAAAGGGALAAGAIGATAVGAGSDMLVMQQTASSVKTLYGEYDKLQTAVEQYGAKSKQAAAAQTQLNAQYKSLAADIGPAAAHAQMQLVQQIGVLAETWHKAMAPATIPATQIMGQGVQMAQTFSPLVGGAAQRNLGMVNQGLQPFTQFMDSAQGGQKVFNDLENTFAKNLPASMSAFNQGAQLVLRTVDLMSPTVGGLTTHLNDMLLRLNAMSDEQLLSHINKHVEQFRLWENLAKALYVDVAALFRAGSGEGDHLVITLTNILQKWGAWENSAKGQSFLHTFFTQRGKELDAIIGLVGAFGRVLLPVYGLVQAGVPIITSLATEIGKVVNFLVDLGHHSSVFRDAILAPIGAGLVIGKLTGFRNEVNFIKDALLGASGALKALLSGEGIKGAVGAIKGVFGSKGGAAAEMETAISTGGKVAAEEMSAAITAAGARVAGMLGMEVKGGAVAGGGAAALGGGGAAAAGAEGGAAGAAARLGGGGIAAIMMGLIAVGNMIHGSGGGGGFRGAVAQGASGASGGLLSPQAARGALNVGGGSVAASIASNVPGIGPVLAGLLQSGGPSKQATVNIKDLGSVANMSTKQLDGLITRLHEADHIKLGGIDQNKKDFIAWANQIRAWRTEWGKGFSTAYTAVNTFTRNSGRDIKSLRDDFDSNMRLIEHTVGLHSKAGIGLMHTNVQRMVQEVTRGMQSGKIDVNTGMREINRALDQGMKLGATDWHTRWSDMFNTLKTLYRSHRIDTATYLADLRKLNQSGIDNIHKDTQTKYQQMYAGLQQQYDQGLITKQQFDQKVRDAQNQANQTQATQLQTFAQNVVTAMSASGAASQGGVKAIIDPLNKALVALGAKPLTVPGVQAAAAAHQVAQAVTAMPKGIIGSLFGHGATGAKIDKPMFIVGEEAPQHPEYVIASNPSYRKRNLQLWQEAGQHLGVPGFATGGQVTASTFGGPGDPGTGSTGYRGDNLFQHPDSFAELNMGRALGGLPYQAPIDVTYHGKTARLFKRDIGAGGPGIGGTVRAVDLWFQAAQALGFSGLDMITVNGGQGVNINIAGGGGAAIPTLKSPHITGAGGYVTAIQKGMDKVTDQANQYLQAHAPAAGAGGGTPAPMAGPQAVQAMIAMADQITGHHYPYVWGGGHNASFSGPYDCSGAVSAVLHAAGLLGSPEVSGALAGWGAPGPGQAVTIYANPAHTWMTLNGHPFGTSGSNPGGGAGWYGGMSTAGFSVRHPPGLAQGGKLTSDQELLVRQVPAHLQAETRALLAREHSAVLPGLARGGRAGFAGWYGAGGSFTANTPTLVGVGDRGAERVDVTPAGAAPRQGVVIQHMVVHYNQSGDLKDAIIAELEEVNRHLESTHVANPAGLMT